MPKTSKEPIGLASPANRAKPATSAKRATAKNQARATKHVERHRDGSVWATGQLLDGKPAGYWEWFRKDGTRMRSGHFENGEPAGVWTTYRQNGDVVKVTTMKPRPK
jgi:antitoxin component YwqK of YwqJK toxin-antitoxin module